LKVGKVHEMLPPREPTAGNVQGVAAPKVEDVTVWPTYLN
jgi:hypothetical protein